MDNLNPFLLRVAFHIETIPFNCIANQITGFYMKCNTEIKSVNQSFKNHFWFVVDTTSFGTSKINNYAESVAWVFLSIYLLVANVLLLNLLIAIFGWVCTAQKMKFSIEVSSVNVTISAVSCRFGHIYWRNS